MKNKNKQKKNKIKSNEKRFSEKENIIILIFIPTQDKEFFFQKKREKGKKNKKIFTRFL